MRPATALLASFLLLAAGSAGAAGDVPFVIVTDASLVPAFTPLALAHTSLGLTTEIHTLQDIRIAFPVAADDAERIRLFLRDAHAQHHTRFVLLGGDEPLIPTRRIVVNVIGADRLLPTDQYFACLDGSWDGDHDGIWGEWRDTNPADMSDDVNLVPQLAVGRAPVLTLPEAQTFVEKTLDALGAQAGMRLGSVLLAAGTSSQGIDLANSTEAMLPSLTADPATHVARLYANYGAWPGSFPESPSAVRDSLNAGYDLAVLMGLGDAGVFVAGSQHPADDLTAADFAGLTNVRPSHAVFMSAFACTPGTSSVGAALLRNPAGGAVSVLGPTDIELVTLSSTFERQILESSYSNGVPTIGEALRNAILGYTSAYVSELKRLTTHGTLLLGDPALAFPGTVSGPTAVAASLVSAEAAPDQVRLVWALTGAAAATIERRTVETAWTAVARRAPDGTGRVAFEDHDVIAGTHFGYRLSFTDGGTTQIAGETWIDVPRPALALAGFAPNPASAGFRVAFRLAGTEPATLEVFDVRGRRVIVREVGALGPGDHLLDVSRDATFAPGVYWLRLTQNGETRSARGVILK